MDVEIDFTKTAQQNAMDMFGKSKKAKKKAEGAEKAAAELRKDLERQQKAEPERKKVKMVVQREWYEKFNWFFTSSGLLAIGGRSAQQNELVNSRFFEDNDLFFHADVFGASVTVLKEGAGAPVEIREEAAQFAACYSSAWENGSATANVYSLGREGVTKSTNKGSLGTGSFSMKGERQWFRGVALELCAYVEKEDGETRFKAVPALTCMKLGTKSYLRLKPGNTKKSDAAKFIAKKLGYDDIDYVMQHLPAGSFSIKEVLL